MPMGAVDPDAVALVAYGFGATGKIAPKIEM